MLYYLADVLGDGLLEPGAVVLDGEAADEGAASRVVGERGDGVSGTRLAGDVLVEVSVIERVEVELDVAVQLVLHRGPDDLVAEAESRLVGPRQVPHDVRDELGGELGEAHGLRDGAGLECSCGVERGRASSSRPRVGSRWRPASTPSIAALEL